MRALTIDTGRLLWKTRGRHWDYEFVCVPATPALPAWAAALDDMLGDADPQRGELRHGLLETDAGRVPWVGVRFLDPERKDWTGRAIQHFAVWFPPLDAAAVDTLPMVVPADWHRQALAGLAATYGADEAFGLGEEAVRTWRKTHLESRATTILRQVKATPPVGPLEGEMAPLQWRRVPTVKKKPRSFG